MSQQYAYKYAVLRANGLCTSVEDTSNYILNPLYVPIDSYNGNYLMKWYHPIPETVTSFDDFQGKWYTSSTYETEWIPE